MEINQTQNWTPQLIQAARPAGGDFSTCVQPKDGFEKIELKTSTFPPGMPTPVSMGLVASLFNNNISSYKPLGGENFVYLINDQWVFRIPKQDYAKSANRREQILLKELNNYVKSTQIPVYKFWDHENGVGGYEEIKGVALSYRFYNNLSAEEKTRLARDLGFALHEIHCLPLKSASFLNNCIPEAKEYIKMAESALGSHGIFSYHEVSQIRQAIGVIKQSIYKSDPALVVLHSDLHCDNILVDPQAKKLSGLIDFSDSRIGFAVIDFANLYRVSPQLAEEAARVYARTKNISAHDFITECRAWSVVWQAAGVAKNYQGKTLREEKRVIRAGRALNFLLGIHTAS